MFNGCVLKAKTRHQIKSTSNQKKHLMNSSTELISSYYFIISLFFLVYAHAQTFIRGVCQNCFVILKTLHIFILESVEFKNLLTKEAVLYSANVLVVM